MPRLKVSRLGTDPSREFIYDIQGESFANRLRDDELEDGCPIEHAGHDGDG